MGIKHTYPAHGWLPVGAHLQWQRDDQGKDFVTDWAGVIQAPGSGYCIRNLSDRPYPNGFGPRYAVVHITSGVFSGHDWYIGHCTSVVAQGQHFAFGHPLAKADQGHPSAIGVSVPSSFRGGGGWVELGEAPNGVPGPMASSHWYDKYLFTPLIVETPDPYLRYGSKGLRVLGLSSRLRNCGWLPRPYWHFNKPVHGATVAFQKFHHLVADGVVGPTTDHTLTVRSEYCLKHHTKEHK